MNKICILFMVIFILSLSNVSYAENYLPDEPEVGRKEAIPYKMIDSYAQALGLWKTAEDINKWVTGSFTYDRARAIELASNQKNRKKGVSVYMPSEFFVTKSGVCVDLARFGVETLKIIDPNSDPNYLMIEFDPIRINGNPFRLHWLVSFKKNGMKYFFCDSKRPGYIGGPYISTQVFISEYEHYRNRKIVAHSEVESYQKRRKSRLQKRQGTKSPNQANSADAKNRAAD